MSLPIRILLVEDNEDDQLFFTIAVSYIKGVSIQGISSSGKEALNWLKNTAVLPDLIFTDINMPGMGGLELLSEIVHDPRTREIPVVILSSATEEIIPAYRLGAKAFIPKQNSCAALQIKLEQMITLGFIKHKELAALSFTPRQ